MSWWSEGPVVVPVDFSEQSLAAIDRALELTGEASSVHVMHVLQELPAAEPGQRWHTVDHKTRVEHVEGTLAERLSDARYQGLHVDVLFGDPGHEIVDFAERIGARVIMIPSHGRRGISRILVGSVAERVVRLAHCPVIVLRK